MMAMLLILAEAQRQEARGTAEAEASESPVSLLPACLHIKIQAFHVYIGRPCFKKNKGIKD